MLEEELQKRKREADDDAGEGAGKAKKEGFKEEEFQDEGIEGPEAFHGADFAETLHHAHQHGIGNADGTDEEREGQKPDRVAEELPAVVCTAGSRVRVRAILVTSAMAIAMVISVSSDRTKRARRDLSAMAMALVTGSRICFWIGVGMTAL